MADVELEKMKIPKTKNLKFKFEIQGDFNITAYVAQQKVNRYLLLHTGNLLHSTDPNLILGDRLRWKVPIGYSVPKKGLLGIVGSVFVDANNGNVLIEQSTPVKEMESNAERLYQKTAS
jgi:hypothetical protein